MNTKLISIISLLFIIYSCKGSNSEDTCLQLFNNAKENLNTYYETNNEMYLEISKQYIDSVNCESFTYKIFNIKISLYNLRKDYNGGINYIKSLDENKFYKPYQKTMYLNNFQILLNNDSTDKNNNDSLYNNTVIEIETYLKDKTDKEAILDLLTLKSKFLSKDSLLKEINSIKKTNKYEDDFLNTVYKTIISESEIK